MKPGGIRVFLGLRLRRSGSRMQPGGWCSPVPRNHEGYQGEIRPHCRGGSAASRITETVVIVGQSGKEEAAEGSQAVAAPAGSG